VTAVICLFIIQEIKEKQKKNKRKFKKNQRKYIKEKENQNKI